MKFTAANCTVLVDEQKKGTIVCDVETVDDRPTSLNVAPVPRGPVRKARRSNVAKKKQSFCEGVRKSCRKRGKSKTPFCKSAMKSCNKKARKGGKSRCPKGRVTRGKRKGRCRK